MNLVSLLLERAAARRVIVAVEVISEQLLDRVLGRDQAPEIVARLNESRQGKGGRGFRIGVC